jgi:hypothetical protein
MLTYADVCGALTDMPPRSDEELDPVTLHNRALMQMEEEPTEGFKKMNWLVGQVLSLLAFLVQKYKY